MAVRERVSIIASSDMKLKDNADLRFGNGANSGSPEVSDVNIRWDGTDLDMLATVDNTVWKIGDGTTSFDVWIYGSGSTEYILWDASADTLYLRGTTHLAVAGTGQFDSSLALGIAGTTTGTLLVDGATSGTVTMTVAAAAGTWTFTLPPDNGDAGEQLQTDGAGVSTWEAAGSRREFKNVHGLGNPKEALDMLIQTPIYRFNYDPDARMSTRDFRTVYMGVMAEDAPWAMHHNGNILNPISTFGYTVLAFQAMQAEIESLRQEVASLRAA